MFPELFNLGRDKLASVDPTTILTGMGVTGVVTTAYLTGRASVKAIRILDEKQKIVGMDEDRPLTNKEVVKAVWPLYVPPVTVGCSTIAAIIMSNHAASKRIAALTVASGISERAFQEYKTKVIEKIGETKETAVRDEIAQDRVSNAPLPTREIILAGTGEVLCFDMTTGRYFQSSMEKIRQAENKINYEIIAHEYASLSAFYDEIGLPPTPYSDTVGWNHDRRLEVTFSTVMSTDQRPCIAIDFADAPFAEYTRMW